LPRIKTIFPFQKIKRNPSHVLSFNSGCNRANKCKGDPLCSVCQVDDSLPKVLYMKKNAGSMWIQIHPSYLGLFGEEFSRSHISEGERRLLMMHWKQIICLRREWAETIICNHQ
jgi:hypothetical protein